MVSVYLKSGEEFKYKLRQVGEEIAEKKRMVGGLRGDLKDIMTRKLQLERRIQPMVCELQKLEDHHHDLIEALLASTNVYSTPTTNTSTTASASNPAVELVASSSASSSSPSPSVSSSSSSPSPFDMNHHNNRGHQNTSHCHNEPNNRSNNNSNNLGQHISYHHNHHDNSTHLLLQDHQSID